ncbi:MAG: damage-control phosphatase ARMT1 family protein [Candidatus Thermoplasmatota archaeon]|jgi:hypothetical protein|nr:damage-control phosphatase ARMT1 family protein [Candidatus Thermoplasmatota archaeon]
MNITRTCYPCFIRQAENEIRGSGLSEDEGNLVLGQLKDMFENMGAELTPVDVSVLIHARMLESGGSEDPYAEMKQVSTDRALEMRDRVLDRLRSSKDPLFESALVSMAGNVMDYGAMNQLDMDATLSRMEENGLGIDDHGAFRKAVISSKDAVFLLDNSGEAVFDGLLMAEMVRVNPTLRIRAYAKRRPLLNDVTVEDALASGLGDIGNVELMALPEDGWIKPDMLKRLSRGAMIVSKGQGNYENLSGEKGIFFLLVVKCPVIGEHLGAEVGDMVLKYSS